MPIWRRSSVRLAIRVPIRRAEGGLFKSAEELCRQYEALLGGTPPEREVVHCGSASAEQRDQSTAGANRDKKNWLTFPASV